MAITAKADVLALTVGTATDIQPAAGEVWLIKSLAFARGANGGANGADWFVALYDGTDIAHFCFFNVPSGGPAYDKAGVFIPGSTTTNSLLDELLQNISIVLTNTVRMRTQFGITTGSAAVFGYSGVLL